MPSVQKACAISVMLTLTLHKADGTLLFWREHIIMLAEGLFDYAGWSVRSMVHTATPVRVLTIMGSARSGSTILDVVLGNHPDIESVGEVNKLIRTGWISRESLRGIDPKRLRRPFCTCGKRLDVLYVDTPDEACPFWSSVRREWVERTDPHSIEGYPKLQDQFEPQGRWPRLIRERRRRSPSFRSYARLTRSFFESIRAVSGKPIIVDCSKISVRTFGLGMMLGIDLYVVHLVRDGRGVIASNIESFRADRPADARRNFIDHLMSKKLVRRRVVYLISPLRWIVGNLLAEWVCARLGPKRSMRLRYEDFVADPEAALERMDSLIGLDLTKVAEAASSGRAMQAGHNVGGNRTKKSGYITLRPDTQEWKTVLSPIEQRLSWILMGCLMRRYGYKR